MGFIDLKGFASVISNEDKSDLRLCISEDLIRGVCVAQPFNLDGNPCLGVTVQQMKR